MIHINRALTLSGAKWLAAGVLALSSVATRADLMIFPTRVVLDGGARSTQVELVNRDAKPASYRINVVNRRMTETGEIVEAPVAQADERFADTMVVFTPRLVTLQPGASQVVRIAVRRPADLAEGEYRTHLQFDRLPDIETSSDIETLPEAAAPGTTSIRLTALIGASIPLIIRQGTTTVNMTLDAPVLEPAAADGKPVLAFEMRRTGNRSVYGDLSVNFTPKGGAPVDLGAVSGVAVYVPNATRKARLPLTLPKGVALANGVIKLTFKARAEAGTALSAETSLNLP